MGDEYRSAKDTMIRLQRDIEERLHMTVITSKLIEGDGAPVRGAPIQVRGENQLERANRMREFFKAATASVAILGAAVAFGAMTASPANAGDFCRRDVTGHMTGCGFDNMAQCQAASSGLGGDCFADPFKNNSQSAQNNSGNALNSSRNAFAYQPKSSRTRTRHASPNAGSPANTNE